MTQLPGNTPRRIESLERQVDALMGVIAGINSQHALPGAGRNPRLAITRPVVGSYPGTGNTFPIVFVDATYAESIGTNALTQVHRQSAPHTVCRHIGGEYIPEDTLVSVWEENDRWWTAGSAPAQANILIIKSELASDLVSSDATADVLASAQVRVAGEYTTGTLAGATDLDYGNHLGLRGSTADEIIAAGRLDSGTGRWVMELLNVRRSNSEVPILVVRSELSADLAAEDLAAEVSESAQELVAGEYTTGTLAGATDLVYLNHLELYGDNGDPILAVGMYDEDDETWQMELINVKRAETDIERAHFGTATAAISRGSAGNVDIEVDGDPTSVVALAILRVAMGGEVVVWPMVGNGSHSWVALPVPIGCYQMSDIWGIGTGGVSGNDRVAKFTEEGCSNEEIADCPASAPLITIFETYAEMIAEYDPAETPAGFQAQVTTGVEAGAYIVTGSAPGEVDAVNEWTAITGGGGGVDDLVSYLDSEGIPHLLFNDDGSAVTLAV